MNDIAKINHKGKKGVKKRPWGGGGDWAAITNTVAQNKRKTVRLKKELLPSKEEGTKLILTDQLLIPRTSEVKEHGLGREVTGGINNRGGCSSRAFLSSGQDQTTTLKKGRTQQKVNHVGGDRQKKTRGKRKNRHT